MSYTTHESLKEIMGTFKEKLPELTKMLHEEIKVETLHGTVEMMTTLIARYDRGEIVEKTKKTR